MRNFIAISLAATALSTPALADNHFAECFDKGTLSWVPCPGSEPLPVAPAPYIPPVYNWTGFYLGVHGGYADADFDGVYAQATPADSLQMSRMDTDGFAYGGQIGYLRDYGTYVVGVELDASIMDGDGSVAAGVNSASAEVNAFGSLRLRGGLNLDEFLPYLTAGVGLIDYDLSVVDGNAGVTVSEDGTAFGGVIGGGLEVLLARQVTLRGEGLYYFMDEDISLATGETVGLDDLWTARAALNYKF